MNGAYPLNILAVLAAPRLLVTTGIKRNAQNLQFAFPLHGLPSAQKFATSTWRQGGSGGTSGTSGVSGVSGR